MAVVAITYSEHELRLLSSKIGGYSKARVAVPAGLIDAGLVTNVAAFSQLLNQAMAMTDGGAIHANTAIVGLPDERAFMQVIELPKRLNHHDFALALDYQWQMYIPIPKSQVYYGYLPVKDGPLSRPVDKSRQRYLVYAYPKNIIDYFSQALVGIGITPRAFVPSSFGVAALFSRRDGLPTMVLSELPDYNLSVGVVKNGLARFSTQLRTPLGSLTMIRQLESVRQFYQSSDTTDTNAISDILILPSPSSSAIVTYVASLGLPAAIADASVVVPAARRFGAEINPFIAHLGLLRRGLWGEGLLPPMIHDQLKAVRQAQFLRATLLTATGIVAVITYISITFITSLGVISRPPSPYTSDFQAQVNQEVQTLHAQIDPISQRLDRITQLAGRRSKTGDLLSIIAAQGAGIPGVTVTNVTYDGTKRTVVITGKRNDTTSLSAYVDKLKAVSQLSQVTASLESWQGTGPVNFTVTAIVVGSQT